MGWCAHCADAFCCLKDHWIPAWRGITLRHNFCALLTWRGFGSDACAVSTRSLSFWAFESTGTQFCTANPLTSSGWWRLPCGARVMTPSGRTQFSRADTLHCHHPTMHPTLLEASLILVAHLANSVDPRRESGSSWSAQGRGRSTSCTRWR